ncbi:MAG TPA: amidohydrolase family protein [Gemmatimonadaceae bacterium]|nr:amidohydrolase family protein [Gemmatimonadaceae bacterium]
MRAALLLAGAATATVACAPAGQGHASSAVPAASASAGRTLAFVNGRWLTDGRFVPMSRRVLAGTLQTGAALPSDSTVDLAGAFVVAPFGEAHNHNIEASSRVDATIARYLRDGVFYVQNPSILPRNRDALTGKVNVPTGVDATFSNGGLTGTGGHPIAIVQRNLARGSWTAADAEGGFFWTIDDGQDLERKWPAIVALRPDFIKVFVLYSDEHARRRTDSTTVGWRGMDPALLPEVVRRAHAARLRVAAHIETAADFRVAIAAGVDQLAHMPGFRGDERVQLRDPAPYMLTDADAREAARRGVVVVTTLGGAAELDPAGADSLTRRALDALHRRNLATLQRAGVRLALGSDSYADDSKGEARYLHSLGVFSDSALVQLWSHDTPRAIFPRRRIGRLAAGDEASFLALACNPFERFACTDSIRLRVKDGRVLEMQR